MADGVFREWLKRRVVCDPKILGGEAVFVGSRLSVRHIGGLPESEEGAVLEDYPYLTLEDVRLARVLVWGSKMAAMIARSAKERHELTIQAAELGKMSKVEFLHRLSELGVETFQQSPEELDAELEILSAAVMGELEASDSKQSEGGDDGDEAATEPGLGWSGSVVLTREGYRQVLDMITGKDDSPPPPALVELFRKRGRHAGGESIGVKPKGKVEEMVAAGIAALKELEKVPPAVRFERMVRCGLIDERGQLVRGNGEEVPISQLRAELEERRGKSCRACAVGMVFPMAKAGRKIVWKGEERELSEDVEVPTCDVCGAVWIDEAMKDGE